MASKRRGVSFDVNPAVDPAVRALTSKPEMSRPDRTIILDARATVAGASSEWPWRCSSWPTDDGLVLIGIQRRGVELAERIAKLIEQTRAPSCPAAPIDITLYRDDLETVGPSPSSRDPHPGELTGKHVVIVDDVLYTGRTVRAALDELADFGRPKRISLCVLVIAEAASCRSSRHRRQAGQG